jgi:O-acetyl-ADP-ribose deacetylase (regulator of RNase III)/uncharacterized protein YwgA
MIHYTKGDLFEAQTEAIINTVNTVGIMGKGIALQFKKRFPRNFYIYRKACEQKDLQIGNLLITQSNSLFFKYIINFPTKTHWRPPSKYEYVEKGLSTLVEKIIELNIKSIAIPPLGTGNGKLEWGKVKRLLEQHLSILEDVEIFVYEPQIQFMERDNIKTVSSTAKLTPIRAMLLHLFHEYEKLDYSLNLLVTQKIAYFLQRFGEPMRLNYDKGWYGPYATNLNKVLQVLNGQYIEYKAQYNQPSTLISTYKNKLPEIISELKKLSDEQKNRLKLFSEFIEGFQTPFSLELLATVDWIKLKSPSITSKEIHAEIKNWTKRKAELIQQHHVQVAYNHLQNYKEKLYS